MSEIEGKQNSNDNGTAGAGFSWDSQSYMNQPGGTASARNAVRYSAGGTASARNAVRYPAGDSAAVPAAGTVHARRAGASISAGSASC